MSALGWAIGGWLFFNIVLVVALLNRRPRPAVREMLFRWVIGKRRLGFPDNPGELNNARYRNSVNARQGSAHWETIPAKVFAVLAVIACLVVGSVVFVSHHPRAVSACVSGCN